VRIEIALPPNLCYTIDKEGFLVEKIYCVGDTVCGAVLHGGV
jgi:hypothetical protein